MDDVLHKEIVNAFFNKSTKGVPKKKRPKKTIKIIIFIASILLASLSSLIIVGIYSKNGINKIVNQPVDIFHLENLIKGGRLNYSKIGKIYFEGDAREKSSLLGFSAKLVNSGNSGNAFLTIVFKEPDDLRRKSILFSGKTIGGEKKIQLILKDIENRSCYFSAISFHPDWTSKYIYLSKKNNFDFEKVKEMRVAFGTQGAGNSQNSTIYIKDIIISTGNPK